MALINYATREINAKIVYYGPGLSGKTTNIHYVFRKVRPGNKGKLVSLATQGDRTLFFDFLPVELGNIKGFKTRFHLYTVPGQVFYNSTRKMVLKGSDGVVFVADSQKMMLEENHQSLENLKANLRDMGLSFDKFPLVIQYNKRDLPNAAPLAELNEAINPSGLPYFEASAVRGDGVLKTLTGIVKFVLHDLKETPDTHSLDFAAIEEAAGSMMEEPLPEPVKETLNSKAALGARAAQSAPELPAAGPKPAGPLPVSDVGEAVETETDIPAVQTVKASAADGAGADADVELPDASPEMFGAYGRKEEDEEVYEAAEVLDGLGEAIHEPEKPAVKMQPAEGPAAAGGAQKELGEKELEKFSYLDALDGPAETHLKTLGEFMDSAPPPLVPEPPEAALAGDDLQEIPDDFHPDLDSNLTGGFDIAPSKDVSGTNEGLQTRPTEALSPKKKEDREGMRVKRAFKLPVKLSTRNGIKEVIISLNVDMEITGEGLAALEGAEIMQPRQSTAARPLVPRPEKDQSKHPPPNLPARPRKADVTDPLIPGRKKGVFDKIFGK